LIQCRTKTQSDNLLKTKLFFDIKVKVYPHPTLNTCKGIIRCRDLANCTDIDEIKTNLKPKGVSDVYRIKSKRDGVLIDTDTYILTFDTPTLPENISIDYQRIKVQPYIPNPLRCFKCQKLGHHFKNCRADAACAKCSEKGHAFDDCQNDYKCANCGECHTSFSKNCPVWKKEKEIQTVKVLQNISFLEARKQVEQRLPPLDKPTYAAAAKSNTDPCTIILEELTKHFPEVLEQILKKLKLSKPETPLTPPFPNDQSTKTKTKVIPSQINLRLSGGVTVPRR